MPYDSGDPKRDHDSTTCNVLHQALLHLKQERVQIGGSELGVNIEISPLGGPYQDDLQEEMWLIIENREEM